jgi:hypothetical protein
VPRYYFDLHEGDRITLDEEGMDLSNLDSAWAEAARSIVELARDKIPNIRDGHKIVIEVRNSHESILAVSVTFETELLGSQAPPPEVADESASAEEIHRLMEAFALSNPAAKAEIINLVEKFVSRSPDFAALLLENKTKH